jgi:hypothetical protein
MISKATDHKATVLMNRRMNGTARLRFGRFAQREHGSDHPEGRHGVGAHSGSDKCVTLSVVIWSVST